jgi:hypothetical protein
MKSLLIITSFTLFTATTLSAQFCPSAQGDEVTYGTNNVWIGYLYDNMGFTNYMGYVNEGSSANPNFDESFGGSTANYVTNGCTVYTETFSARYKLTKNFAASNYLFTVGADDGYRLSLDGGATWVINNWNDHGYTTSTYSVALNGNYDMVLEFYENGGGNRISFDVQTLCIGIEDQTIYGSGNVWKGYIYDGTNFNFYGGTVSEGSAVNPNFDENFGGDNVTYNTSACGVRTETFTARYRLQKTFANGNYTFIVGGDDGYRFSLDGGSTWVIDHWVAQSYNTSSYSATLNGTYNLVLEYFENGGQNRITMNVTTVLPVKLISFNGKKAGRNIDLNWSVTEEVNTAFYAVERSADGIDFSAIGKLSTNNQGIGLGTEKNYSYTDLSPIEGSNYYRLRIVDNDEKYTYSPITRIAYHEKTSVTIFPTVNTGGNIYLRTAANLKSASVELYDLTGKKLQEIKLQTNITAGQTITLPLRSELLTKGTYLVICKSAGNLVTKQVIINQ